MIQIRHYAASGTLAKTIALTYDNVGNLKTYNDGITSAAYDYDDVYRKTQETVNYGAFSLTTSYAYNKNGTKKSFTYPGGVTIDYTYDGNNQPLGMNIPGAGYLTYNTYRWNRPTAITLPGGGTKQYDYDPLMRTKTIAGNNPSQNPILSYQYGYDKMDNITQKNTEHGNYGYGYDELYRLIQAANAAQGDEAYTYDQVGNRLTSTAASDWTYNQNNEFQSYSGVSFQYDANGNATQKNEGAQIRDFIYDADNRLIEVRDGSNSTIATYSYDLFGRRIKKDVGGTVTYYLYSDEGLIGEYGSAGNEIKTYGYKPNSTWTTDPVFMKEGGNHYFYHNDHLGTPQKITTLSGAVVWSASYDAFGKATVDASSTIVSNLRFPGQYFDEETRLHYNWFRYYEPESGRYVQKDPAGLIGGINLFAYVFNSPLHYLDPWGLYGPGVHRDDTQRIAIEVGMSPDCAKIIAMYNNNVDKKYDPVFGEDNQINQRNWHFIPRSRVDELINNAMNTGSQEDFGEALHALQDYYSHTLTGFKPGLGHFLAKPDPDIPANYPELYSAMLEETRQKIMQFTEIHKCPPQ